MGDPKFEKELSQEAEGGRQCQRGGGRDQPIALKPVLATSSLDVLYAKYKNLEKPSLKLPTPRCRRRNRNVIETPGVVAQPEHTRVSWIKKSINN